MAKKSIYWPSVKSFLGSEFVDKAVIDTCDRVDVVEPKPSSKPEQSFGNAASIVDALESLDESNVDDSDRQGLAECLSLIDVEKYASKPDEAKIIDVPQEKEAKPQVEKKKRASKAKSVVPDELKPTEADLVQATASVTIEAENDAPNTDLEKVESPDTSDAPSE